MLSDLRAVSVTIKRLPFWSDCKGLKMKTYILSWRSHKKGLCRCRFEPSQVVLKHPEFNAVEAFCFILCIVGSPCFSYRLSSCGKLVARQATYQGV